MTDAAPLNDAFHVLDLTGLLLGRRDIIAGARANAAPNMGIGRSMKVGKEELAAIVVAVEAAVGVDQAELLAGYERVVGSWIAALQGIPGIEAERAFPSEAGQPHSRVKLRLEPASTVTAGRLEQALWHADPRIAVLVLDEHTIAMNPQTVAPDEVTLVSDGLVRTLHELGFGAAEAELPSIRRRTRCPRRRSSRRCPRLDG